MVRFWMGCRGWSSLCLGGLRLGIEYRHTTDWLAGSYLHVRICLRYQPHTPGRAFPNCSPAHNTVEQRYYVHGLLSHKWLVFKVILGVPADWTLCSAGHESEIHGRRRFGLAGGAPLSEEIIGPSSWAGDAVTKDCV